MPDHESIIFSRSTIKQSIQIKLYIQLFSIERNIDPSQYNCQDKKLKFVWSPLEIITYYIFAIDFDSTHLTAYT